MKEMREMEEKILNSFKKKAKEAKDLDLIVSIPEDFDYEHECEVMEKQDNGKVWNVVCTRSGNVKDYYEI